jgi:hypothetical protein
LRIQIDEFHRVTRPGQRNGGRHATDTAAHDKNLLLLHLHEPPWMGWHAARIAV